MVDKNAHNRYTDLVADHEIEIEDANALEVLSQFSGLRVESITREPNSGEDWQHAENSVRIVFEDGSHLAFYGFGYDASGLSTYYTPPSEKVFIAISFLRRIAAAFKVLI